MQGGGEQQAHRAEIGAPEGDSDRVHVRPFPVRTLASALAGDGLYLTLFRCCRPCLQRRSLPRHHPPMSTVFNFTFVPWFRSVAPYIHMHRGKTFVVGVAGEAIAAGKLQAHRAGPGADPEHGRQGGAGARLPPAGERAAQGQGPRGEVLARHAHHRRSGARLRAGGRRPAALRDRGRLQHGPAQHADGRLDHPRHLRQLHHRAPGGHRRRRRLPPFGPGAQGRRRRHHAARWTTARWCCCRRSASRPPARPSTSRWRKSRPAWPSRCRPTSWCS